MAEQIRSDRAKHDAKGKQVESIRKEENEDKGQNQSGDTNMSEGNIASINQEKVDEMYVSACKICTCFFFLAKVHELIFLLLVLRLAASLAAEEETGFTGEGKQHFTSVPLQDGAEIDEDEDDDEGMIFVSIFSQLN